MGFLFGLLKFHNFIGGGGGGMPDILDILFSVNSKCSVHAYTYEEKLRVHAPLVESCVV